MGWTIKLISDKVITKEQVSSSLNNLPQNLKGSIFGYQGWGWTAVVDVYNPKESELKLGGSYTHSGRFADEFSKYIALELSKFGHKIEIGEMN